MAQPSEDDRAAAEAVGGHADEGRGDVHAGDVPADDEADDAQVGVAMFQMDRGHGHDGGHDRLADAHGAETEPGGRDGADEERRFA